MTQNNPLVSVIIPVYNVASYLREAIDSVVNQTYETLQVLVVDDGSTDRSGDICDEYRTDPRITVFHQKNRGVSRARNMGLDHATGDFIAFLDSDDAYHPSFIQTMLDIILREKCDIVECAYMNYRLTLDSKGWTGSIAKEGSFDRVESLHGLIDGKFCLGVWNKLYRKELWKEIRFPEGHFFEDDEVVYSVFNLIDRLYYLDQPLYFYRRRLGSTTYTFTRKMVEDRKLSHDHVLAFVKNHTPEVFNEADLYKVLQSRMGAMIKFYAKGAAGIRDLREICEGIDPKKMRIRGRMAYWIIRWCPWTLKLFSAIYWPLRMLAQRVFKI